MSRDRVFKDTRSFLDDFFLSFGEPVNVSPTSYFFKLFQEPVGFPDLLEKCQPSSSPKVLLLDGQSRTGKTWTAVGLVKELLNRQLVDVVWSSGEDSRFVYSDARTTIADGIEWVINSLRSFLEEQPRSGVRVIVLLDDFFGPARLRALASNQSGYQLVKECLTLGGEQNPILKSLRSYQNAQASLLLTGRSSIFSLAEIQLGVPLGARAGLNGGRYERAVYQRVSGRLIGAGTHEWLDRCLMQHNEFVSEHQEFNLPPITAFSDTFPPDEPYSSEIPEILFGGDLRAIIDELKFVPLSRSHIKPSLRRLLLVYVAPSLALPLPSIDWCLTGHENPKRVRAVLSLQPEEHGDFALRVPNKYYLRAVQQVLLEPDSLILLADSLIAHAKDLDEHCEKRMRILSRGLIERGLEAVNEALELKGNIGERHAAELRKALFEKVHELPGAEKESLLRWEAALISGSPDSQVMTEVAENVPRYPGLASAIGWGLYRFGRDQSIQSVTLNNICDAFERRAKELGDQEDHQILTVAYSNFIRWTAQMEETPTEKSPIHQLAQIPASIASHHKAKATLRMVLEDALIWADSFKLDKDKFLTVRNLPQAHELWDTLESEAHDPVTEVTREDFLIANRLFSLEWHNEWKERPGYRREVLFSWLQNNNEVALELIKAKPELLDDNLTYHWLHMIAQWSVWARDWCFSPDPNAHEYQKEPIGCSDESKNQGIHKILRQAIDSTLDHENPHNRLRNAFFLLAIRAGNLLNDDPTEVHLYLNEVIERAGSASEDIKKNIVQAIYELVRQGYLDRIETGVPVQQDDDRKHLLPKDLRIQCTKFLDLYGADEWRAYLKELKAITCLDVLPHDEEVDLIPYGRSV